MQEQNKMKKNIKFYFALYLAKISIICLKIIKKDATHFPGKIAIKICPDFLGRIEKPETIIGVTGTNGKTTVCNMIEQVLKDSNYEFIDNHLGANINTGIASTLIKEANLKGKQKKKIAVFEIDERSAVKIYPYITPTYLVCTNLFRDSMHRNAHTEFIFSILDKYIPKETILILNGDDLISSELGKENKKVYFGIDRLPTDTEQCKNIVCDRVLCPKCDHKLEYDFVRYHHIGRAHCLNCEFKSPKIDYEVEKLDLEQGKVLLKNKDEQEEYNIINDNIINIYNMIAAITLLKEFGINTKQIKESLKNQKIVDTRFSKENVNGIEVITNLAKGLNPIACSRVFEYVKKEEGTKAVFIVLDDLFEDCENTSWQYDTDYEFLNDASIKQILIAGARYLDGCVRLQIAGVPKENIVAQRDEVSLVEKLNLEGIDKVFILHELYAISIKNQLKEKVEEKIKTEKKEES